MEMKFLLVGEPDDSIWETTLRKTLAPLGQLDCTPEAKVLEQLRQGQYDLIIVDAVKSRDVVELVSLLRHQRPLVPIVVVTASPTWQRARQVFLAGASDYLQKSLNTDALLAAFKAIIDRSR